MVRIHIIGFAMIVILPVAAVGTARAEEKMPNWTTVQNVVQQHLSEKKGYRPGDLLSKGDVDGIFAELRSLGWKVKDQKEISKQVLADDDFLVKQLRENWSSALTRSVSGKKLLYDRLDRVSRVDNGKQLINDICKLPDAKYALDYLEDLLPKKPGGRTRKVKDFDKPTGRIYTEQQFVKRLRQSFDQALAST